MSPWAVRNTLLALGPSFKRGPVSRLPAGNVDVVTTILQLLGSVTCPAWTAAFFARRFDDGSDQEQVPVQTRTHITISTSGAYGTAVQVSEVGHQRYVDKAGDAGRPSRCGNGTPEPGQAAPSTGYRGWTVTDRARWSLAVLSAAEKPVARRSGESHT
jgi:hypothetical protein